MNKLANLFFSQRYNNEAKPIDNIENIEDDIKKNTDDDDFYVIEDDFEFKNIKEKNNVPFLQNCKMKLSNLKNSIVYSSLTQGHKSFTSELKEMSNVVVNIFDKTYKCEDTQLLNELNNIPWFSYRKNFEPIKKLDKISTSDAGWGCTLRSTQMLLAQGLMKLDDNIKTLDDFIKFYLPLFYDNNINKKFLYLEKDKDKTLKLEKKNSFEIINECPIQGLDKFATDHNNEEEITPPFSLRSFLDEQYKYFGFSKEIGEWFSNIDTMKLITCLSNFLFESNKVNYKSFNYDNGKVYLSDIIEQCCTEAVCTCKANKDMDRTNVINDFDIIGETCHCFDDTISLGNDSKKYKLKTNFLMFVSIGVKLDYYMKNEILKFFDIPTNIGIMGGSNNRSYYFIGKYKEKLIFLDPHFVQDCLTISQLTTDFANNSYKPNQFYCIDTLKISNAFSIGFAVNSSKKLKRLFKYLTDEEKYFTENFYRKRRYLFEVKIYRKPNQFNK